MMINAEKFKPRGLLTADPIEVFGNKFFLAGQLTNASLSTFTKFNSSLN